MRSRRGRRKAGWRRSIGRTQWSFGHDLEDAALDEERIVVQVMLNPAHLDDAEITSHRGAHADVDLAQAQVDDRVREESLDEERIVVQVMLNPAHLDDAEITSHRGAHADVDLAQAQVDDRVREEFLDAEVGEGGRIPRHLRDEEGRRVQVSQLLEELEDLVPRALERSEGVQRVEAVERDEVAPHFLLVARELTTQAQEPPGLLADLLDLAPQRAHVDDVDALRVPRIHAERGHLRDERGAALLHRQVEPRGAVFLRLVEEDAIDERRLQ